MATIGDGIVAGAAAAVPGNGVHGTADMSCPKTFIKLHARLVVNNGEVDVAASFANALYEKNNQAVAPIDADMLNANLYLLGRIIAVADLVHLLTVAQLGGGQLALANGVEFRVSDVIQIADFNASPASGNLADAQRIIGFLYSPAGAEYLDKTTADGFYYLQLVGMVYLHRERAAGHNCFTNEIMTDGSVTAKCFDVGGAHKAELQRVAMKDSCGHDLFHFLSNNQLEDIARAMAGDVDWWIPAGTRMNGQQIAAATSLHELLKLGEAFSDRIPEAMLGLSAIYIGLDCMLAVLGFLEIRVTGGYNTMHDAKIFVNGLRDHLDNGLGTREALLELKNALFPILAIFCGCTSVMQDYKSLTDSKPSVDKMAKLYKAQYLQGKALKEGLESLAVDDSLVSEVINSALDGFTAVVRPLIANPPAWTNGGVMP